VPVVFPGFQLTFRQTAGFDPLRLPIQPSFPVKVLKGPLASNAGSIWVIDGGDFQSQSISTASTIGKVYRVEGVALSVVNTLE
jgi:hypothetical protein